MIRVIGNDGINWNWYLCGDFDDVDKIVHIFYYERWHKYENRGSGHPANAEWNVGLQMIETKDGRVVFGVKLNGVEYLVTNPKYVFDYKDFSAYVSE